MDFIDYEDEKYPKSLRHIEDPPKRLYYKGNLELLKADAIAIIGSRDITEYGKNIGKEFIRGIALRDIVVVSRNGYWCR